MPVRSPELIGEIAPFGDDAVERCAGRLEPRLGVGEPCRRRRQPDRFRTRGSICGKNASSPARARPASSRSASWPSASDQQIEQYQQRRRFDGKLTDPARRRMNALQQRIERKSAADRHDDLAVEQRIFWPERAQVPSRARGSNVSSSGRTSIAVRPSCRRETPDSGSHPISARIATACRPEFRRRKAPPSD